jgi:hypothetical protein
MRRRALHWSAAVLVALAGCRSSPSTAPGTGAAEVARTYFEALVHHEWPRAYEQLHPQSLQRLSVEQFARLAQVHLRNLSFEPNSVQIRSCEEHGDEATAHIALIGHGQYRDAVALRRHDGAWKVILPANFGHLPPGEHK